MSVFDFLSRKNAVTARKKAEKAALQGGKKTYLLNEDTPFAVTEAFRSLKMTLSVSLAKTQDGSGVKGKVDRLIVSIGGLKAAEGTQNNLIIEGIYVGK